MSQTTNDNYADFDGNPSKAPDYLVAFGGWPILYAMADDSYTLSAGAHDLSSTNGFTTIRKWASAPTGAAAKVKGRPEGGGMSIGEYTVEILDKYATGARELSDLVSRQAYVEGVSSGTITTLNGAISSATTTVILSGGSFVEGDTVHVSQEAIKLGATADSLTFTGCTRGYLLTSPTPHSDGVKAYSFKPTLYRSRAFIYKGYTALTLPSWLRAFGGIVVGEGKDPGKVGITMRSTTWETYADKRKHILGRLPTVTGTIDSAAWVGGTFTGNNSGGGHGPNGGLVGGPAATPAEFQVEVMTTAKIPTGFGDGNYMIGTGGGVWHGIKALVAEHLAMHGGSNLLLTLVKGLSVSNWQGTDDLIDSPVKFAWTNADFRNDPPTGSDPIDLLLRLLLSRDGDSANGTYDTLKYGIGLGIPVDLVDTASFEAIQAQEDYDSNMRVYFAFIEPQEAKKWIDEQLCKPFGWYLLTGNDGKIKLIRPKHPQKYHVSRENNYVRFKAITSTGATLTAPISSGVYTAAEIATAVQNALNSVSSGFTVTYSNSTHLFSITHTGTDWDLIGSGGFNTVWVTIGMDDVTGQTAGVAYDSGNTTGVFTPRVDGTADLTDYSTVSQDDVWGIQGVDNRDAQITSVRFDSNYSWAENEFLHHDIYHDAEWENLGDLPGGREYQIQSKGLLSTGTLVVQGQRINPFRSWKSGGGMAAGVCYPVPVTPSTSYGLDALDSWASLFVSMLFDRYKTPPDRFKCKMKWKFNTCEPGDVLKFSYNIDGVFVDRERNETTLTSRLFEILNIKPNFRGGYCEVELQGFRRVPY